MNTKSFSNAATKLKETTIRFLKFMRIVGEDNHIDWTTTSLVVVVFILAFKVTSPGIGELGALLLTLLARGHKKYLGSKADERHAQLEAVVKAAKEEIHDINTAQDEQLQAIKNDVQALSKQSQKATEYMADLNTKLGLSDYTAFPPMR